MLVCFSCVDEISNCITCHCCVYCFISLPTITYCRFEGTGNMCFRFFTLMLIFDYIFLLPLITGEVAATAIIRSLVHFRQQGVSTGGNNICSAVSKPVLQKVLSVRAVVQQWRCDVPLSSLAYVSRAHLPSSAWQSKHRNHIKAAEPGHSAPVYWFVILPPKVNYRGVSKGRQAICKEFESCSLTFLLGQMKK